MKALKRFPPLIVLLFFVTSLHVAFAQPQPTWSDITGTKPATLCDIEVIFSQLITVTVAATGLAVFIMFLIGGFKMITSGGDAKASEQARNTLTFAIVGLALLVGSAFILKFIQFFTGVDVLHFAVCKP